MGWRWGNPYLLLTMVSVIGLLSFSIGQMAVSANGKTEKFGPFESGSPDSSTCGGFWADDEYDLSFKVKENNDGTFTVRVEYKNGTFVTREGPSPGACQDESEDGTPPGWLEAGIKGKMHGYLVAEAMGSVTLTWIAVMMARIASRGRTSLKNPFFPALMFRLPGGPFITQHLAQRTRTLLNTSGKMPMRV